MTLKRGQQWVVLNRGKQDSGSKLVDDGGQLKNAITNDCFLSLHCTGPPPLVAKKSRSGLHSAPSILRNSTGTMLIRRGSKCESFWSVC
jgi:hypothetical protein